MYEVLKNKKNLIALKRDEMTQELITSRGTPIWQKLTYQKVELMEVSIWSDHPKNAIRI